MINKEFEELIEKQHITKTSNIIYGTNIPMPKAVIPTPWKTYINFEESQGYFFFFDERGITLYPLHRDDFVTIPWTEIEDFKIKHIFIIGKMTIKTKDATYKFQINRKVIGCPWIRENTEYLESYNYFYNK